MNALWIMGGVFVLSLPVLAIWYLRALGPHSKKMSYEQGQLNKKTGANNGTSATTSKKGNEEKEWYLWWSVLLVLVGGALVYWGLDTQVRPVDVGSLSADKWFPLLVIWGVLAGLIALNAKALGATAKTLQWVLGGAMLALLIAFPLWSWVVGEEKPSVPLTLTSAPRSGTLVIPVGSRSELVLPLAGQHPEFTAVGRFLTHNVREDGSECSFGEAGCVNGPRLKGYYVTNESNTTAIVVTFEFKHD